ncbi:phage tail tape measure protein [Comamonas terrigena]|uniref:phage tail tape measure protein n=1 Tax=Comamonas terrigena TaxID=32013 RepID=UPI0028AA70AB|nr:phage tail tape measure protein [Comamonas terrigena]
MSNDMVAQIAVTADSSGVEAGVGRVKRSLAELGSAAKVAGDEMGKAGDQMQKAGDQMEASGGRAERSGGRMEKSSDQAARKMEQLTRSMQLSLQRQIAELEAGGKSSRQYVESLAQLRGVDVSALTPLLDKLDQLRKRTDDAKKAAESFSTGAKARADSFQSEQSALAVAEKSAISYESTFLRLKQSLIGAAAGFTVMGLIDTADSWGQVAIRVEQATKNQAEYNLVMQRTAQSAKETFRDVTEVRELYIRAGGSIRELGYSLSQTLDLTDSFSLLLVTNAASGERASAAISAYSKAIQTGRIDTDSWQAILAAMPTVIDKIAASTGLTAAEIKRLGIEGKLSLLDFNKTLIGTVEDNRKAAEAMPTAVRDAVQSFKTSFAEIIGWQNQAYGVTATLVKGMNLLGNNLDVVATAAGGLALVMGSRVVVSAGMATGAFLVQQVAVVQLGAAISGTSVASVAGLTAVSVASRAAAASFAFLMGPWGATLLLAGTAAAAFYSFRKSAVDLQQAIGDLNQPLDKLQERLDKLPEEKRISIILDFKDKVTQKATEAQQAYEGLGTAVLGTLMNSGASEAEIQKFHDRLVALKNDGGSLIPVLKDAAKAANLGGDIPRNWLTLAGNLREAQGAAETMRATAQGLTAGGGAGESDPAALLSKQAVAAAQASLTATTSYKSLAEQMAEVKKQGEDAQSALKGLEKTGQGASKEADQLRSRIGGLDDALKRLKDQGSSSTKKTLSDALAIDLQVYQKQIEAASFVNAQAQKIMEARRSAGQLDDAEYYAARAAFINLEADAQERLLKLQLERYKQETVTKDNRLQIVKGIEETEAKLGKASAERGAALEVLGIQQDAALKAQESSLQAATQAAQEYLDTLQRGFSRDVAAVGMGTVRRSEMAGKQQIEDRYASQRLALANERAKSVSDANGELTAAQRKLYDDRLAAMNSAEQKALSAYEKGLEQRKVAEADWALGARSAFDDYQASAANVALMSADVFASAFSGMEDALVSFVMTGKGDFTSLANSVIADLVRIQIRANMVAMLGGNSGGGGILGTIFGGVMAVASPTALASSGMTVGGVDGMNGYSGGGYTGPGEKTKVAGLVHAGEVVWSQDDVSRAGGVAAVETMRLGMAVAQPSFSPQLAIASAGGPSSIKVELINSGQPMQVERTEATQGADGQVLLKAFLKEAVSGAVNEVSNQISGRYGAVDKSLQQRDRMGG